MPPIIGQKKAKNRGFTVKKSVFNKFSLCGNNEKKVRFSSLSIRFRANSGKP
jgi:hypothetical protein